MTGMLFDIPQPEKPIANPTPDIANAPYKLSVVDSKKTPIETLAAYIGGSNFINNYYSQKLTKSEELKPFDPFQLNVYQSYHKINNFIIKLQGALSNADDSSTGRFNITGSAIIPPMPNLIPNYGDAFVADIGEGRAGQFTVTEVKKLTANFASAWQIEFKLERIADQQIVELLDSKVTTESFFQKDYLITGQNPLLTTEDFQASNRLEDLYKSIARQFIRKHYSLSVRSLIVPMQDMITYDTYLVKAILRLLTPDDVPEIRSITAFNCDDYRINAYSDVYSMVINQDPTMLYSLFRDFRGIDTVQLKSAAFQNPIRYSGIKRVLVPYIEELSNDNFTSLHELIARGEDLTRPSINTDAPEARDDCGCSNEYNPAYQQQQQEVSPESLMAGMQIPKISNASYVMSPAFYDQNLVECTLFERDIWNIVNRKPVDRKNVYAYCESFPKWGKLEQFFLTPFLLLMIKYAIRGI